MVGDPRRVQFWPLLLFAGPGMFFEHQMLQKFGSLSGGVWAYSAMTKLPLGASCPNSTLDFSLLTTRAKPASFHWLSRICSVSSRRLLPVVDLTSICAFWPPLAQMPSAPLVQPSLVI